MGLVLKNVSKTFVGKQAVDKISFRLDKPGVFGLLGTNGAGKTTTIRMLLGIIKKIVVHMFESLHFDVIGQNYHNIEKQSNWVAVYDLWHRRNFDEMFDLAEQLYPGFLKN